MNCCTLKGLTFNITLKLQKNIYKPTKNLRPCQYTGQLSSFHSTWIFPTQDPRPLAIYKPNHMWSHHLARQQWHLPTGPHLIWYGHWPGYHTSTSGRNRQGSAGHTKESHYCSKICLYGLFPPIILSVVGDESNGGSAVVCIILVCVTKGKYEATARKKLEFFLSYTDISSVNKVDAG